MNKNVVGWFEIPTGDMERAIQFYKDVFGFEFHRMKMPQLDMAMFPSVNDGMGSGGALVHNKEFYKPLDNGVLIYFTSPSGNVANELGKVEAAGGKIFVPRTQISEEYGYMGIIIDTEGNRIGLHSRK
jgi:predicted enzyme related to lactoylglutathione lyase